MKVMCTNDKPMFDMPRAPWLIKAGEIYEVLSEKNFPEWGLYYCLDIQPTAYYASEHFSPLSDISETSFIREYNTEKV